MKDNIDFSLIIDDDSYDKNNYLSFKNAGLHTVIYEFKNELDTLEDLFYEINNLIEVDFSEFVTNNIKSMSNLFRQCNNLIEVDFSQLETENIKSMA